MSTTLDSARLLADTDTHRLVLQATLVPVTGDLFQPAAFPDIGHVIYDAPRPVMEETGEGKDKKLVQAKDADGNPRWSKEKVCIVDSAASMANHLEAVSLASTQTLELHPDLAGMPYVECVTDAADGTPGRLVVTSLSEGHRLASSYFVEEKKASNGVLVQNERVTTEKFSTRLRSEFGIQDRTHPLPGDWWNVFRTIFRYDPNSLVHGILFPAMGIKLSRFLTAHHEAFGADRVGLSGVKFDKLGKTTSGQPIFAVDKETATEIRATFVLDLSLLRSFGNGRNGLNDAQKLFLLDFALWKIGRLLSSPYRFRSGCDLELATLSRIENGQSSELPLAALQPKIAAAIANAGFTSPHITKVYWPADELFKPGRDEQEASTAGDETEEGTE